MIRKISLSKLRYRRSLNNFDNPNAEPWYRWIFRRNDALPAITFYFLSQINSTSPRFFPMYNHSKKFRIVVLKGTRIPRSDALMLRLLRLVVFLHKKSIERYEWFAPTDFGSATRVNTNLIIHIDDPTYTSEEEEALTKIYFEKIRKGRKCLVICTNLYTKTIFAKSLPEKSILLVPQGHTNKDFLKMSRKVSKNETFRVVYSSPYIEITGDKKQGHEGWDATHLITEIIPDVLARSVSIEFVLIGRLGKEAKKYLSQFPNVKQAGLVSFKENSKLLAICDLAIYPRKRDNFRSVQKIVDYLGSGLPIVSYDLVDTNLVRELRIGVSVMEKEEFIESVLSLSKRDRNYRNYLKNAGSHVNEFYWGNIIDSFEENLI